MSQLSRIGLTALTLVVLCLGHAAVTRADSIAFTGTIQTFNPPAAANVGRCGAFPLNLFSTHNSGTGISNLGPFASTVSNCFNRETGNVFNGLFSFDFANANTLFGTIGGTIAPRVGDVSTNLFIYSITGGTGLFNGASGTLSGPGMVTFVTGGNNGMYTLSGTITTVPEPATMLLLGTGLAGVGAAVRNRHKAKSREEI